MSKMSLDEFRILHSTLIEHYQYIEENLKGLYASICGHEFFDGLEEVEQHNLRRLLKEINRLDTQNELSLFSVADYERFNSICDRRNFWCHNCYVSIVFDHKTDAPKYDKDIESLTRDIRDAEELRDMLFQKKLELR